MNWQQIMGLLLWRPGSSIRRGASPSWSVRSRCSWPHACTRLEDGEAEPCGAPTGVGVTVGDVAREAGRCSGAQVMDLPVDGQPDVPAQDVEQLAGADAVRL